MALIGVDGCFLFHVVYDSDSDEEDMELWEVKKIKHPKLMCN